MLTVDLLEAADLDEFAAHFGRQVSQSGSEGLPVFNPFPASHRWDLGAVRARRVTQWALPVGTVGWGRAWGARDGEVLVGHVELDGGSLESDQHRARLGMGIERAYHRQGTGTRLLDACVEWAVGQPSLSWIDLGVFAHNEAAIGLYRRAGFVTVGEKKDRFRVDGRSIDDLQLVLDLDARRRRGARLDGR